MSEIINKLSDGAFALIIVTLFIAFIYAKVTKKTMGELFNDLMDWINGPRSTKLKGVEKKQLWKPKTI